MKNKTYYNERGAQYFFPKNAIIEFYRKLPVTKYYDNIYAMVKEPIAVLAVDDFCDDETLNICRSYGVRFSCFYLSYKLRKPVNHLIDPAFHFDKDYGPIDIQIRQFKNQTGRRPLINRNHRMWWRSDNLDLAYLAMNGFKVDSTKIGIRPYLLCVEGKLLPIWEVPFSVYEFSCENSLHAAYQPVKDFITLFKKGITPIVTLLHPITIQQKYQFKSQLDRFIDTGKNKYGYNFMTMTEFYNKILKPQEPDFLRRSRYA